MARFAGLMPRKMDGLHARDVGPEIVVVHPATGQAHVLRGVAAELWRAWDDGPRPEASDEEIRGALLELETAGLTESVGGLSRRDVLRRGATVAVAGVVISIGLPTVQAAASGPGHGTATTLTGTSPAPGQVQLTATLAYDTEDASAHPPASGSMEFFEVVAGSPVSRGIVSVSGPGNYVLNLSSVAAGDHYYYAEYAGDTWFVTSRSEGDVMVRVGAAAATVAFVSASQATGSATAITYAKPAGIAEGMLLIASVAVTHAGTARTVTPPTGWTLILRTDNGTLLGHASYYKYATASEPANYTFNVSGAATRLGGGVLAYSGVPASGAVATNAGTTGTAAGPVAPSVTTGGANRVVVALWATEKNATMTEPTQFTQRWETSTGTGSNTLATQAAGRTYATSTTTGALTVSQSGGNTAAYTGQTLVIRGIY